MFGTIELIGMAAFAVLAVVIAVSYAGALLFMRKENEWDAVVVRIEPRKFLGMEIVDKKVTVRLEGGIKDERGDDGRIKDDGIKSAGARRDGAHWLYVSGDGGLKEGDRVRVYWHPWMERVPSSWFVNGAVPVSKRFEMVCCAVIIGGGVGMMVWGMMGEL